MAVAETLYRRWRDPIFLLIFALGVLLRMVRLNFPGEPCFDEIYYVPAAEDYLQCRPDANSVHPPLAKIQMAAVILIMDTLKAHGLMWNFDPILPGRVPSLLAGVGVLWLTHRLAYTISGRQTVANLSLFLVSLDFLSIAQSRIAMLDEIQAFWILAGFVLTAEVLFENKGRDHVVFAALCFGVATACKWNGLFAAGGAWLALMGGVTGGRCGDDPVPYPRRSWGHRLGCTLIFLFCGILVYAAAYIPFLLTEGSAGLESWQKIYGFHERMIRFRYDAAQFNHRYLSQFYEWPLVLRPVWYYYVESESVVQGIVGIGCVVFWWPAFFLILESLWLGYRGVLPRASVPPDPLAQFVCCFYFPQWVLWASSTTGGFFYYMIPVVPIMAVAMARHLDELLSQEGNQGKTLATGYLAFLFLCTVAYYPLLTGISVSEGYFRFLFFVERWI